jgi:hypothetical protein
MKVFRHEFVVPRGLRETFRMAFDEPATLDAVHGEGMWTAGPWAGGQRDISFDMPPVGVPPALLAFVGRGKIEARVRQTRTGDADSEIVVSNRVRPKIIGAELVRIRPRFTLRKVSDKETAVAVACEVHAIVPPPLAGIAEGFMVKTAELSFSFLERSLPKLDHGTRGDPV